MKYTVITYYTASHVTTSDTDTIEEAVEAAWDQAPSLCNQCSELDLGDGYGSEVYQEGQGDPVDDTTGHNDLRELRKAARALLLDLDRSGVKGETLDAVKALL